MCIHYHSETKKFIVFDRAIINLYFINEGDTLPLLVGSIQNKGNLASIKANVLKNDCTYACDIVSFYLLFVNRNAKNGCFCC